MPHSGSFPVRLQFPLHWGEMDAMGHVNNTRYFTWFESARIALFRRVGIAQGAGDGVGPILAHTACDFLVPVTWPATLEVGTRIVKLGRTSFTMEYAVWRLAGEGDAPESEPTLVATGSGVVVLIDYRRGGSVPIGDDLRRELEALG